MTRWGKKWDGSEFTLETFADIWDPPLTGCRISQQEMDDEMFREVATQKGFTLRHQEERLPDPAILVGIELYLDQLMSLDAVCARTPFPLRRIQLVNLGGHSREEWDQLALGIGPIFTSPLVAIWRNSRWESILVGRSAQDMLSAGLSDFLIG